MMVKTRPNLSIDAEVWEKFKATGVNASAIVEDSMRTALAAHGIDVKTVAEIEQERKAEQRKQQEAEAKKAREVQKAYAAGHMTVDENTPALFKASRLFFDAPQHRPGR